MTIYGGIDLHSNNSFVVLIDEGDRVKYSKRLPNNLSLILKELEPYTESIEGIAVESTFNWYWLVDGLMKAGYDLHLVNTASVIQYSGLKYSDDKYDARWLAHLLHLGILPEGYIYPKKERAVRDLLRKRALLVRQRTVNVLSMQNILSRSAGLKVNGNMAKKMNENDLDELLTDPNVALSAKSNLKICKCLDTAISKLEHTVHSQAKLKPEYSLLHTVNGIGNILALTIMFEAGDINRFRKAGNFSSYCRCVPSKKISNNKKKGSGNTKNGNKYLAWAFVEAANFAIRYNDVIKGYYQSKRAKTKAVIAIKTVAHKLARACYYVMRDQVPFDVERAFGHK